MNTTRTRSRRLGRGRSVVAGLLAVIAVLGVLASVIAVWAQNVLFDADSMVTAVNTALDEPEVTDAMAVYVTDQIFTLVDVDGFVTGVLPEQLQPLEGALVGGARSLVQDRVETVLVADGTRQLIDKVVVKGHAALMKLLEGDGLSGGITVVEGKVTVNTLPIISRGLLAVQDKGLFTKFDVPEFTADQDAADQIAELEAMTGRDLPDDIGQLVVYESGALAQGQTTLANAQRAVVLVKRSIVGILILTVVSIVGAVLVAQRRRRMAIGLGLAGVMMLFVAQAVINKVIDQAPTLVVQPGARAAIGSTVRSLASGLLTLVYITIIVGLVLVLVAWITGASASAMAIRNRAGSSGGSLWAWVDTHRDIVAIFAGALAVLLIAVAGINTVTIIIGIVLGVVAAAALVTSDRGEASLGSGPTGPPAAT
ncbi:MAG: hypothetical protein WD023_02675 [Ilumatobacteraceae bacterium]